MTTKTKNGLTLATCVVIGLALLGALCYQIETNAKHAEHLRNLDNYVLANQERLLRIEVKLDALLSAMTSHVGESKAK